VIIRLVEGDAAARQPLEHRLARETEFITSQLSRLECRCRPMRDNNAALLKLYDQFFASRELRLLEIDVRVIDEATAIRATTGFRAPDAIHLAAAVTGGASAFLTGDVQLSRFNRLTIELI
jgi:predicted nucleic acid-binding protein